MHAACYVAWIGQPQRRDAAMRRLHQTCLRLAACAAILVTIGSVGDLVIPTDQALAARTIKLVVPFPPGGGADTLARLLAERMGRAHALNVIVENRPGAGTTIATEAVSRAAPDGNTMLLVANSFVINPSLKRLNYDPLKSFDPICLLTRSPNVIAVNSASPYRSLQDLITAARARPAELTMAFQGPGTGQHVGFEKLKRAADINMIHVPFTGSAPAVSALLGGHVAALFANYPSVMEQIRSGQLRALAFASATRVRSQPDVPTIAELGFTDYVEEDVWFGVVAPAKTSPAAAAQLAAWFGAVMKAPELQERLSPLELYPVVTCGEDFAGYLRQQHREYQRVIRGAKMGLD
jgi:tripartite-type tricarboxylate transporter receptor subunit TctC